MTTKTPIAAFFDRAFSDDSYPRIKYSPDATSLCLFGPIDSGGMIHWRPVHRAASRRPHLLDRYSSSNFVGLAKEFVSGFWSSQLECWFGYESFSLDCGAWNETAYRRKLVQLEIHFQNQEDLDLPNSLPLGLSSSGSECAYAMQLDSGEIWLEEPDGRPFERQADSLAAFFAGLRYQPVSEDLLDKVFD